MIANKTYRVCSKRIVENRFGRMMCGSVGCCEFGDMPCECIGCTFACKKDKVDGLGIVKVEHGFESIARTPEHEHKRQENRRMKKQTKKPAVAKNTRGKTTVTNVKKATKKAVTNKGKRK